MILALSRQKVQKEFNFLIFLSILCFGFSVFRYFYADTQMFLFLNWNLFLAFIPWALSRYLKRYFDINQKESKIKKTLLLIFTLVSWMLFFPNAPYILTDLFHLKIQSRMPPWFDLMLILSFAWTGLFFGFLSLFNIEDVVRNYISAKWIPIISSFLLFIASFGVYLGRFLRWNSWDILHSPFALFYDVGHRIINPIEHPRAWGMTLFMGIFLNMIYWSFRMMKAKS